LLIELLIGLLVILIGAEFFTNGIEWLGYRLGLSEGAVGSILAAVGTALPESIIPIVAILFSQEPNTSHIGIGAILGAPFMLGTLALFFTGVSARCFTWRGRGVRILSVDTQIITRDLSVFVIMYSLALAVSLSERAIVHQVTAVALVLAYLSYVIVTLKSGGQLAGDDLKPLYCWFWCKPGIFPIIFQVLAALGLIIWGANFFVQGINSLADIMGISSMILALVIAPIATELPEKFNSVIWIAQRKDTLALGNITGAMVFQSSVIPAFGMLFTPWQLNGIALLSGMLVIASIMIIIWKLHSNKTLYTSSLIFSGIFYAIFIGFIIWGVRG